MKRMVTSLEISLTEEQLSNINFELWFAEYQKFKSLKFEEIEKMNEDECFRMFFEVYVYQYIILTEPPEEKEEKAKEKEKDKSESPRKLVRKKSIETFKILKSRKMGSD